MLLLAVSTALLALSGQAVPSNNLEMAASGLVALGSKESPSGFAVLISDQGLFLASSVVAKSNSTIGFSRSGQTLRMRKIGADSMTQLVLLEAQDWRTGQFNPVRLASESDVLTQRLVAMSSDGPIFGQLISQNRNGLLQSSRRYVRLWELEFESTGRKLGGAPVLTVDGRLAGILNATLEPVFGMGQAQPKGLANQAAPEKFGPHGVTVGYALGPKVLSRVVEGFLSEDHEVDHPFVGILYKNASGGVVVTSVSKGSPAGKIGLRPGDIITRFGELQSPDSISLAVMLFEAEVEETMAVRFKRGEEVYVRDLKIESTSRKSTQSGSITLEP